MGRKPLPFRLNKKDGFIKNYDRTIYLELFGLERYDAIYDMIKYLLLEKSDITYSIVIIMQEPELIDTILYL